MEDRYEQEYKRLNRTKGLWGAPLPGISLFYTGRTAAGNQAQLDAINALRNLKEQDAEVAPLGGLQAVQKVQTQQPQNNPADIVAYLMSCISNENLPIEARRMCKDQLDSLMNTANDRLPLQQPSSGRGIR